ncbi:hypothetical protein L2E82_29768 [Cichorium intybus]|uniref:Uncharacterized protein n=1 Tax=Cichorium intybus TaxID=13427 RepID=A0ACB9CYJ8_CICIN|nr:hypothetical protein L2E82_29768 [Cichorium intybus]
MLGRLYFNNGGKSKWMITLIQTAGFPLMYPFIFFFSPSKTQPENHHVAGKPSWTTLVILYTTLGTFFATDCMLYTFGLNFLPVSTYSLICASQLAFNAFFSYFLNGQKFTPYIANSLVLLSFSSTLLVFQSDEEQTGKISRSKYIIGFVCTVAASAGYGLMLSITQLAFQKILKSTSYKVVFDMIVYQNMVASVGILMGLFASGEWKDIDGEMRSFESGTVSYIMNLVWTAVAWQVFSVGCIGLIFEVSSLFSNVITTLGIPIVPVLAVVFFHEKMNGVKVISMLLAIWGFISYIYQHYIDDSKEKAKARLVNHDRHVRLLYLPVSTYSLICASQLGFNAVFAFFLNQQKLTPYIMNSIFILTLSTILLVIQGDSSESIYTSKRRYTFGFVCTISASAGYALLLSLTQLSYQKIVKDESFRAVLSMIIYQSMVSSFVIVIGIFASGDWKMLRGEMMEFELGEVLYVMILVSKAVSWQIFSIGIMGLTFKVTSLFSNVVSTVGLPIVPILAVVFFHDEMSGVKIVSMVMAVWGFLSYLYQHYLDHTKAESQNRD